MKIFKVCCALLQFLESHFTWKVYLLTFFSSDLKLTTSPHAWNIQNKNPSKSFKFHQVPLFEHLKETVLYLEDAWGFFVGKLILSITTISGCGKEKRMKISKIFCYRIKYFHVYVNYHHRTNSRLSHLKPDNKILSKVIFSNPSVASNKFPSSDSGPELLIIIP